MASMSSITEQYVLAKWTLALTDKISTDSKCNASAATLSILWLLYMRTGAGSCNCKHVKMSIESNRSRDKTMVKKIYLNEKCLINGWFFTHTNLPALLPRSWSISYYFFFFSLEYLLSSFTIKFRRIDAFLAYNPAKISKYISKRDASTKD